MSALGEFVLGKLSRDPAAGDYLNEAYEAKHNDVFASMRELRRTFPGMDRQIAGKKVLDIGCAEGLESLALAKLSAGFVQGIDIRIDEERSKETLRQSDGNVRLSVIDATKMPFRGEFDAVVTCGSFEHFDDPYVVLMECTHALKLGGRIYLTSGVWAHPYGAHMNFFTNVPWVHYLFSERTIMNVRKRYRGDGAMHFRDVPGGLNTVGVSSFLGMVDALGLQIEYLKLNPIKGLTSLTRIPFVRELFTNLIVAVLRKNEEFKPLRSRLSDGRLGGLIYHFSETPFMASRARKEWDY